LGALHRQPLRTGVTGALDLPGRPDQPRFASRQVPAVPGHGGLHQNTARRSGY